MPYEVARAYDKDKNLVPLYVLYDGEVPEVSPGFDVTASSSNLILISSNSSNPTGGNFDKIYGRDSASTGTTINTIKIYNNSAFHINVVVGVSNSSAECDMQPNSNTVLNINAGSLYAYWINVSVHRIRS